MCTHAARSHQLCDEGFILYQIVANSELNRVYKITLGLLLGYKKNPCS
jgi:hypothetical protein